MVKMEDAADSKLFNRMKYFYKIKIEELPEDIEQYI